MGVKASIFDIERGNIVCFLTIEYGLATQNPERRKRQCSLKTKQWSGINLKERKLENLEEKTINGLRPGKYDLTLLVGGRKELRRRGDIELCENGGKRFVTRNPPRESYDSSTAIRRINGKKGKKAKRDKKGKKHG